MQSKGQETHNHILKESRKLFTVQGFQNTSISQVIAATGVKKGNLYYHFPSKEALGLAVLIDAKEEFATILEDSLSGDGLCLDTRSGKMWQVGRSKTFTSLETAKGYTSALENGGYNDWRLPSVAELYELYMIFDLHENGNCKLDAEGTYWSDEADLEGRVGTWELDDNCDPERRYIPKQRGKVRAIRS